MAARPWPVSNTIANEIVSTTAVGPEAAQDMQFLQGTFNVGMKKLKALVCPICNGFGHY